MTTPFTVFWFFSCLFFACILWRLGESLRIPWWAMGIVALSLTLVGPQLARLPRSVGTALPAMVFIAVGRACIPARAPRAEILAHRTCCPDGCRSRADHGSDPRLDLKNGYFGTPILGVMIACLICAGLLSCTNAVAARTGKLGHGLSSVVSVYGSAVILAHGVPVYALHGRAAVGLVLVGVVFGTFVLVGAAPLTPWRSALLGLRRAPRPEAELSA